MRRLNLADWLLLAFLAAAIIYGAVAGTLAYLRAL